MIDTIVNYFYYSLHVALVISLITDERQLCVKQFVYCHIVLDECVLRPMYGTIDACLYQSLAHTFTLFLALEEHRHKQRTTVFVEICNKPQPLRSLPFFFAHALLPDRSASKWNTKGHPSVGSRNLPSSDDQSVRKHQGKTFCPPPCSRPDTLPSPS